MGKEVTLASGTVVRLNAVPSMIVLAVSNSIPEPKVPMWHNEAKDRDEPNPVDPEYLEAVKKRQADIGQLTTAAYLANGVEIIELAPGKFRENDDAWIERLEIVGLKPRREGLGRFVDWLQYHVLGDDDLNEIIMGIATAGGTVTEEEVALAAESFRDNQNGTANTELSAQTALRQRDTAEFDPRPSD